MSWNDDIAIIIPVHFSDTERPRLRDGEIHVITGNHRAVQMNEGAARTKKKFLWFLHADSIVADECYQRLECCLKRNPNALYYFNLKFKHDGPPFMFINAFGANFRSHFLKIPFGDQALCISKENFETLGGFDETTSYGEDHLLVWKARRNGIPVVCTGATIVTSARKYRKNGWLKTTLNHLKLTYLQALPEVLKGVKVKKTRKGALAIFVKTPGLSPVKTRLAAAIGKEKAEEVYLKLVKLTEQVAKDAEKNLSVTPYWAIAETNGKDHSLWRHFSQVSQGDGDLGERLSKVYNELLENHDFVFLIGADCPDLNVQVLKEAKNRLCTSNCVIGRTVDGGFYLFGGRLPIGSEIWGGIPFSTDMAAQKLIEALGSKFSVSEIEELRDLDTEEDLKRSDYLLE